MPVALGLRTLVRASQSVWEGVWPPPVAASRFLDATYDRVDAVFTFKICPSTEERAGVWRGRPGCADSRFLTRPVVSTGSGIELATDQESNAEMTQVIATLELS